MATTTTLSQISVPKFNAGVTGDTFIIDDGTSDHTSEEAITKSVIVRTKNKHKHIIKGGPIDYKAANIEFNGFDLQYSKSGDYINIENPGVKLLNNKMHFANTSTGKWIVVNDPDVSIIGNEIYNKTSMDTFITVNEPGAKIQNNYFHDQIGSGTPMEAIRVGASSVATKDFRCDISGNTFERIKADTELMTIKGCNIDIHDNIFKDNNSSPTFRHGRNNKFRNNKLEGTGLRIYGKGHTVIGNKFLRNPNNQLRQIVIGNGQYKEEEENTTAGYTQVRDLLFQDNYIDMQDSQDEIIFCFGYGSSSLKPVSNKIIGNTIVASKGTLANTRDGASWTNNTITDNVLWTTPGGTAKYGDMPTSGYTKKDPTAVTPTPEPTPPPVALTLEQRVEALEAWRKAVEEAAKSA